jgi:hypothetical protein
VALEIVNSLYGVLTGIFIKLYQADFPSLAVPASISLGLVGVDSEQLEERHGLRKQPFSDVFCKKPLLSVLKTILSIKLKAASYFGILFYYPCHNITVYVHKPPFIWFFANTSDFTYQRPRIASLLTTYEIKILIPISHLKFPKQLKNFKVNNYEQASQLPIPPYFHVFGREIHGGFSSHTS